jgi:spore germination protein YaaH
MKLLGKIIIVFVILGFIAWVYLSKTFPATPSQTSALYFLEHLLKPQIQYKNYVIGFLPYWRLDQINSIQPNRLSELNYFSLSVDPDGHIAKIANGQTDPGWNGWTKQATKDFITKSQIMGANVTVTIAAQDNQLIENILNSNSVQQNLISDIVQEVKKRKLNGVNIDFEYTGEPDDALQTEFTNFSKKLETELKQQSPSAQLSLSIMPLSARNKDLYNFPQLVPIYDRFIGMSYDYYGQSSDIAGPVAPMNGFKEGNYFFDVTTTYADYLKFIPKSKLVMGVPAYGWEWAVANGSTIKSATYPADSPDSYAAVISYARAREDSDLKPSQCRWDPVSQESWCWFTDKTTGIDHQIWIADNRMIQTRFDYANKENFGGIALWTLGLDKNYPDIWDRLDSTFGK